MLAYLTKGLGALLFEEYVPIPNRKKKQAPRRTKPVEKIL